MRRDRNAKFSAENLESRRLLAITVTGTAAADVIRIAADGVNVLVVLNGVESRFAADPTGIVVNAGNGNDTVRLDDASSLPVTINGGANDDRIEIGAGNVRAARLTGVNVVGNAGNDTLVVNDAIAVTGNTAVSIDNPIDTYLSIVAAPGTSIRSDASNAANAVETVIYNGTPQADTVNVLGTNALATVLVIGGNGDDSMTVGADLDTTMKGLVTLDGQAGANSLTVDDSADTSLSDSYFMAGTATVGTIRKSSGGSTMSYTNFATARVVAGTAGFVPNTQFFRVTSVPDATAMTLLAGNGDDTLFFGDGAATLDNFEANLTFDGGEDVDLINYNDTVGSDPAAYAVNPTSITNIGTATLNFTQAEQLTLTANGVANDLRVNATTPDLGVTLNGGAGNDTLHIGNGDFDATILGGVSILGGAGNDTLLIEDAADNAGDDTYTFGTDSGAFFGFMNRGTSIAFWSTAAATRVEAITLLGSANADSIRMNNATPAIKFTIDAGGGDDSIFIASTTEGSAAATAVTLVSGAGNDSLDLNSDNAGNDALASFVSPLEEFRDFRVRAGGRAIIESGANGVLAVRGLLNLLGRLDVANATVIVSGGSYSAIDSLATTGYAGGTWTGGAAAAAIVSSAAAASSMNDALAVVLAADLELPVFAGLPTMAGDVVVRYTRSGDANLDRIVDFGDLVILAQNYGQAGRTWAQCDFTYDVNGLVDFDDLVVLAQNYSQSLFTPLVIQKNAATKDLDSKMAPRPTAVQRRS